jgi:hypothetical protein
MEFWHPWLSYLGLLCGIVASAVLGASLLRSALIGLAGGAVLALLVNVLDPTPAPCLQNAKGWDILRAYSLDCGKQ